MHITYIDNLIVLSEVRGNYISYTAWMKVVSLRDFSIFRHFNGVLYARIDKQALPPETLFDDFQATLKAVALHIIFKVYPDLEDYEVDRMYAEVRTCNHQSNYVESLELALYPV